MVTLILFISMESFNLKSFQGRVKLCRVNESIIVCVNSFEILDGGIDPFRLLQSDQTVPVEVEAEKVFHRMAVDQVGVELTIGLGDGCGCWSFHSSSVWAVFLWCRTRSFFIIPFYAPSVDSITVAAKNNKFQSSNSRLKGWWEAERRRAGERTTWPRKLSSLNWSQVNLISELQKRKN